jgi:hypothetical protein
MKKQTRILPLPEALARGPWSIKEHRSRGGQTSRASREITVPLSGDKFSRGIQAHELLHLKYSPAKPTPARYRVSLDSLLACEDGRVNELGAKYGLANVLWGIDYNADELDMLNADHAKELVLLRVASNRLRCSEQIDHALGSSEKGRSLLRVAHRAVSMLRASRNIDKHAAAVRVARWIDSLFSAPVDGATKENGLEKLLEQMLEYGTPNRGHDSRWGKLESIVEQTRSIPHRVRGRMRARAVEEGSYIRSPWRDDIDGRIFSQRNREQRGTVLMDCSGSMHLDAGDVLSVLDVAPMSTFATYSGSGSRGIGKLFVLAKNRRRVSNESIQRAANAFGGNVIDGPALAWLAKQDEPRVWISDGLVTGVEETVTSALSADALRICIAARIVRVPDVERAITYFQKRLHAR